MQNKRNRNKCRAETIILAHNHPSGQLRASQADIKITNNLVQAGNLLTIPVYDHIILSPEGGYYSFADDGLISILRASPPTHGKASPRIPQAGAHGRSLLAICTPILAERQRLKQGFSLNY